VSVAADRLDLRYRGGPHVESWFAKAHQPDGKRALWLKITVVGREGAGVPPVAEAWAVLFDREKGHVATKSTVPLGTARFARGSLDVEVDGCELSMGRARGAIASGGRRVAWDLAIGPERSHPVVHLPAPSLYDARLPSTKLVTPLSDGRMTGHVEVDRGEGEGAERWVVEAWPAMIGHNWGPSHARLWAWVHCNTWEIAGVPTEELVLEAVSGRVRMGPVPALSPMGTAVFVRWRGERWDLNARELFGQNRGSISQRSWECTAEGKGARVRAEVGAETDDFVGLHYANPSGTQAYCLHTELARARVELSLPGGRTIVATSRAAALEIGTRDTRHGVRMYL